MIIGLLKYFLVFDMARLESHIKHNLYSQANETIADFAKYITNDDPLELLVARQNMVCKTLYNYFDNWNFCGIYYQPFDEYFPETNTQTYKNELRIWVHESDKIPCNPISLDGICGDAIRGGSPNIIVPDVSLSENHIVCDKNTKSELVIPFTFDFGGSSSNMPIKMVLDIDSKELNDFNDGIDVEYLNEIMRKFFRTQQEI